MCVDFGDLFLLFLNDPHESGILYFYGKISTTIGRVAINVPVPNQDEL